MTFLREIIFFISYVISGRQCACPVGEPLLERPAPELRVVGGAPAEAALVDGVQELLPQQAGVLLARQEGPAADAAEGRGLDEMEGCLHVARMSRGYFNVWFLNTIKL